MNLRSELQAFDGTHMAPLEHVATHLQDQPAAIDDLCILAAEPDTTLQTAATWVLKRLQEKGAVFSSAQTEALLDLLAYVSPWSAQLHLLQLLPGLTIPAHAKTHLYEVLSNLRTSKKTFVRAWAYNGLAVLAEQYPAFRAEVAGLLYHEEPNEKASVKARIRNLRKAYPWLQPYS